VLNVHTTDHLPGKMLVIVNQFDQRPLADLQNLLTALHSHTTDIAFDTCVVINQSLAERKVRDLPNVDFLHYRENTGMNIGAWDYGWREHPGYDCYLF
jgi:lipopolysaccharide biosynthesis protein